ncbi:hypothetical protein NGM10_00400 [Halorussus salilacus]|uniref:hypothetical protein n=1 Tax=Halorussus salilacus TaxID=2953750 RepID=UPI0020A22E33|nr:hypothetical protein [Halorussus salilacus]USZ68219.1 hypothetical protein NGM10_00400 [Halorussus salilacus]
MTDKPTQSETHDDTRTRRLERASTNRSLDTDALAHARADAQVVLEQTIQTFTDLSDKAFRLVRLNGLVVTIVIAISSQIETKAYVNVASLASILLFICSALFAIIGYRIRTIDGGISTDAFQKLTSYKLREKEYLNWVLTLGYPKWIADGVQKTNRKERWIGYSLLAFLGGMAMLLAGTFLAIY